MKTPANATAAQRPCPHTVQLDTPIARGETSLTCVTVLKPNAGTLRGASLAALANSDVDALIKVLPRMTHPALTESEVAAMDLPDVVQLAAQVIGFLAPGSAR